MNSAELKQVADHLRMTAVDMVYKGKDGHPGPALSIADIMAVLFFDEMRIDPANPDWEDRDRFILSKGHACPIYYAALSERGYFGEKIEDFKLRALGSKFAGNDLHSGNYHLASGYYGSLIVTDKIYKNSRRFSYEQRRTETGGRSSSDDSRGYGL